MIGSAVCSHGTNRVDLHAQRVDLDTVIAAAATFWLPAVGGMIYSTFASLNIARMYRQANENALEIVDKAWRIRYQVDKTKTLAIKRYKLDKVTKVTGGWLTRRCIWVVESWLAATPFVGLLSEAMIYGARRSTRDSTTNYTLLYNEDTLKQDTIVPLPAALPGGPVISQSRGPSRAPSVEGSLG